MKTATDIQRLALGSDLTMRRRHFTPSSFAHPAKLHLGLYQWIVNRYTLPGETIADPMAGIGTCLVAAAWQRNVIAREIEPRWLALAHENAAAILREAGLFAGAINVGAGDAREPWGYEADHIIFSPPYACSMSKGKTAKGTLPMSLRANRKDVPYSKRWNQLIESGAQGAPGYLMMSYGQEPGQIGHLRGRAYWDAMTEIYGRAHDALRAGVMALIIKDHIRNGARVTVAADTVTLCESLGFALQEQHKRIVYPLSLWQRRRKEQGMPVVEDEDVIVFRRAGL